MGKLLLLRLILDKNLNAFKETKNINTLLGN